MNNISDPHFNFYQDNVTNVRANHFLMTEVKSSLAGFDPNDFSVFHLNITNMKENFENFTEFHKNSMVNVSVICLFDSWCESQDESLNQNHILLG